MAGILNSLWTMVGPPAKNGEVFEEPLWIAMFVLMGAGIIVILVSLVWRKDLQKDTVFGQPERGRFYMKTPVLGVSLLLGSAMCLVGIVAYLYLFVEDVSGLRKQLDEANEEVEAAQYFSVTLHIIPPEGTRITSQQIGIGKLECHYAYDLTPPIHWNDEYVSRGTGPDLTCPALDITRKTVIQVLYLQNGPSGKPIGEASNIFPLQPTVKLEKPQEGD